jgi:hypothetical protein
MLVSKLFAGNTALQKCAEHDQAHLAPGSRGDAVALVQRALVALVHADISEEEITTKTYGSTTAREVLKYKTNRKIINFSYQTKPDNIVGKMTITTLDREMSQLEFACIVANGRKQCVIS